MPSRRQSISGYRQEWINSVRENFAGILNVADEIAEIAIENTAART